MSAWWEKKLNEFDLLSDEQHARVHGLILEVITREREGRGYIPPVGEFEFPHEHISNPGTLFAKIELTKEQQEAFAKTGTLSFEWVMTSGVVEEEKSE